MDRSKEEKVNNEKASRTWLQEIRREKENIQILLLKKLPHKRRKSIRKYNPNKSNRRLDIREQEKNINIIKKVNTVINVFVSSFFLLS